MKTRAFLSSGKLRSPRHASGAVLIMTLICLTLLMIGAVALSRSSMNSLLQAGNFSFKRDMLNQAERGMAAAVYQLSNSSGKLYSESNRQADVVAVNYSATQLDTNDQGIPLVLLNSSKYSAKSFTGASIDIDETSSSPPGYFIRTVIDRQCYTGTTAYTSTSCVMYAIDPAYSLTGTARLQRIKSSSLPTYRITVRVSSVNASGTEGAGRGGEFYAQMFVTR